MPSYKIIHISLTVPSVFLGDRPSYQMLLSVHICSLKTWKGFIKGIMCFVNKNKLIMLSV